MQQEDACIQSPQVRPQHLTQRRSCLTHRRLHRIGHQPPQHADGQQRQRPGKEEHAGQPDTLIQHRPHHQRHRIGHGNHHADERHGLAAVLVAGGIGHQRTDGRRNRTGALKRPAQGQHRHRVGHGRQHAAGRHHQQPHRDDLLAPEAIGRRTVGNLQQRLREAIGPEGEAHPGRIISPRQLPGVQREHRQDQEQPQHANGVQTGQPEAGSQFLARHAHRPAVLIAGRRLTEGIVHADMGNRVVVATTMVSVARQRPGKAHAAPLFRRPMRRHRGAIPGRNPPYCLIVQRTNTADQHPPCRAPYNGSPARPPDQLGIVSGSPRYGIRRTPIPTA